MTTQFNPKDAVCDGNGVSGWNPRISSVKFILSDVNGSYPLNQSSIRQSFQLTAKKTKGWIILLKVYNNNACHARYNIRHLVLLKILFKKNDSNEIKTSAKCDNHYVFKNFLFFAKETEFRWTKNCFWKQIIWCAFYSKQATFDAFQKFHFFFQKNPCIFAKKKKFGTIWENSLFQTLPETNLL